MLVIWIVSIIIVIILIHILQYIYIYIYIYIFDMCIFGVFIVMDVKYTVKYCNIFSINKLLMIFKFEKLQFPSLLLSDLHSVAPHIQ